MNITRRRMPAKRGRKSALVPASAMGKQQSTFTDCGGKIGASWAWQAPSKKQKDSEDE